MPASIDEEAVHALASNCGRYFVAGARAMGKPWQVDEDLLLADLGFPVAAPPNHACITREALAHDSGMVARRTFDFFSAHPGGGFQVWSLWSSLDLSAHGFSMSPTPCMVRDAGGKMPGAPPELQVEEVTDDLGMQDVWTILNDVFLNGLAPTQLWDARVLSDDCRIWLGRVDGRAVTTSTQYVSDGYVGIYAVGTIPDARGRGYGEAMTWVATMCRPDLPATLQASVMGKPIYERMGFRDVATFDVWRRNDRIAG